MIPTLLSLAVPLIIPVLKGVESIFGAKTGKAKAEAALAALTPILQQMATAGKLPGPVPDATALQSVLEIVFQANKKDIENVNTPVGAAFPVTAAGFRTILIPPGATITIQFPETTK